MPETKPEPKHPGAPGWDEALQKRHAAALAWLESNIQIELVMPLSVVRDLYPEGFDVDRFQPILGKVMPGEVGEAAERGSDHCFVILRRG